MRSSPPIYNLICIILYFSFDTRTPSLSVESRFSKMPADTAMGHFFKGDYDIYRDLSDKPPLFPQTCGLLVLKSFFLPILLLICFASTLKEQNALPLKSDPSKLHYE